MEFTPEEKALLVEILNQVSVPVKVAPQIFTIINKLEAPHPTESATEGGVA